MDPKKHSPPLAHDGPAAFLGLGSPALLHWALILIDTRAAASVPATAGGGGSSQQAAHLTPAYAVQHRVLSGDVAEQSGAGPERSCFGTTRLFSSASSGVGDHVVAAPRPAPWEDVVSLAATEPRSACVSGDEYCTA
ncbi:hypothetical protein Zm00014a_007522 [Zea mays]|jgi:hypothetical protein|uniref:Uncharacterized protein n=1 Tax=Zea mays TaxID=4577 RepID=A0A3L6E9L3_MAIZE|nr:hypothetical protein Zm00014a_007522 [Zea mays]